MNALATDLRLFNNPRLAPKGWYWALPSARLARGATHSLELFGRSLVLYRDDQDQVHALDAYCRHMGAHLGDGQVEGACLRCPFHGWKYAGDGECVEIPGLEAGANPHTTATGLPAFAVAERFGMIWFHPDAKPADPLPDFPELSGARTTHALDPEETRHCHPTLILGGGVDEEHFLFVHRETTHATGALKFESERLSKRALRFRNSARIPTRSLLGRVMSFLYDGVLTYEVTYHSGTTAFAKLGPPFFPLYSIFAYRPTPDGQTQGLNIYVTPRRRGPWGWLVSRVALAVTRAILRKGGGEDRPIQNKMRFRLGPRALSNPPFAAFVRYVEEQESFPVPYVE